MQIRPMRKKHLASALCAAALMLAAGTAHAAESSTTMTPQARYQQDIAACKSGTSGQTRDACMSEAGAALQAARNQKLNDVTPEQRERNLLARCERMPDPQQRQNCVTKMTAPTSVQGSVQSGGILREAVIPVPASTEQPAITEPAGGSTTMPVR